MNNTSVETTKLLVVEDNVDLANLIRWELEDEGFETDHACNGAEALEMFDPNVYHCILSDLFMPDMDGINLVKHIREDYKSIPIFIMSAMKTETNVKALVPYNISAFFQKPLEGDDIDQLCQLLKNV